MIFSKKFQFILFCSGIVEMLCLGSTTALAGRNFPATTVSSLNIWQAILLGAVQGITEFLPIGTAILYTSKETPIAAEIPDRQFS